MRNFGIGTRDLAAAGQRFLQQAADKKALSFSSVATISNRWEQFASFAKSRGVGSLEKITTQLVQQYAQQLQNRIAVGSMSAATAQNYISAVNSTMSATPTNWKVVRPVADCALPHRSNVRTAPPASLDSTKFANARAQMSARDDALVQVAKNFGLRSKEAALFDAKSALKQAEKQGIIEIRSGTKGGRVRFVKITQDHQIEVLRNAAKVQQDSHNFIDKDRTYRDFGKDLNNIRGTLKSSTGKCLHDLRAAYACERYQQITGHPAPVVAGKMLADKSADLLARQQIANELGHGRIDVTVSYLGGR